MNSDSITVRTFKYDGALHRSWTATLAHRSSSLLILDARFDEEINHPILGTIADGTVSIEYYWLNRWYNVFRFMYPTGGLHCFYCNVNVPPVLHRNVLTYVDLDIDILVRPDLSYTILDEDEFAAHAERFDYPQHVVVNSREARDRLVEMIERRQFPFDFPQ